MRFAIQRMGRIMGFLIKHSTRSYRLRLALVLLVAFLPFIIYDFYKNFQIHSMTEEQLIANASSTIADLAREHADMLSAVEREMYLVASANQVRKLDKAQQCRTYLLDFLGISEKYVNVAVADTDGQLVCTAMEGMRQVSPEARKTFDISLEQDAFATGSAVVSSSHNKPIFPAAHPIRDDSGDVSGMLMAGIALNWFNEIILDRFDFLNSTLFIADIHNTLIAQHPMAASEIGKPIDSRGISDVLEGDYGVVTLKDDDGLRYVVHQRFKDGMSIVMEVNASELQARANQMLWQSILYFLLVIVISLALTSYTAKKLIVEEVDTLYRMNIAQSKYTTASEILINIAHQWRQPLNNLSLQLESVAEVVEDTRTGLTGEARDIAKAYMEESHNSLQKLSNTITEFSTFFKSERSPRQINMKKVFTDVIQVVQPHLDELEVEFTQSVEDDVTYIGYESELKHSLLSIVNNTIDAFRRDPDLESNKILRMQALRRGNREVIIEVMDNAGGIDPAMKEKVFEPYTTTKFRAPGTGLGLYTVKSIIEQRLGGHVSMESSAGETRVYVVLPMTKK
ncbi:sensor histidine kinase [Desulfurispira natronophila]|uniref:histidine kinase n=1 Tax=Desulfurispira natronophila TaxID=682562 RepID=A0A7W7Y490_9BACT|nr:ATP-binding protein [Desulfurispira natronophila]MBB5021754.1 signal transduction histidine kinase [Desulfurispira natronophila]